MRTVDHPSRAGHSLHDWLGERLRLALRIGGMVFYYFTEGRRIRKAYERREASGETFWVDESMPEDR